MTKIKSDYFERVEKIKNTDNAITKLKVFDEYISISADFELGDHGHFLFEKNDKNLNIAFIIQEMLRDHLADIDDYKDINSFLNSESKSLFKIKKGFSTGHRTIKHSKSDQPPIIKILLSDYESFDVVYHTDYGVWETGPVYEVADGVELMETFCTFRFLSIGSGIVLNTDLVTGIIENHHTADDYPATNWFIVYLGDKPLITIRHDDIRFAYSIVELIKKHLTAYATIEKEANEIKIIPKNKPDFMI